MAVDFRHGTVTPPDERFRVTNLKKLNFEVFKQACITCMQEAPKYRAQLNIPSSEEYILYKGKGFSNAVIRVRNWYGYLSVHCESKDGAWIISSHIGGKSQDDCIREGWRQVSRAKSLVNANVSKIKEWG